MIASLQSLLPVYTPEEARIYLSHDQGSLQATIRQALPSDRNAAYSQPRSLDAEFASKLSTPEVNTKLTTDTTPLRPQCGRVWET